MAKKNNGGDEQHHDNCAPRQQRFARKLNFHSDFSFRFWFKTKTPRCLCLAQYVVLRKLFYTAENATGLDLGKIVGKSAGCQGRIFCFIEQCGLSQRHESDPIRKFIGQSDGGDDRERFGIRRQTTLQIDNEDSFDVSSAFKMIF